MKKRNVINLIRYHAENNDAAFRNEARAIAQEFSETGDYQLAEYITALMSDANTFVPQSYDGSSEFLQRVEQSGRPLPLPQPIAEDVKGVCNAIAHDAGVNKFLFQGAPGTGKTETAKQIARITGRDLFIVDFSTVIDSMLGQTAKNIHTLFADINGFARPSRVIVLFDEIDALALDRVNKNDVREMGRATSTLLKELDGLNEQVVLIATTNLYSKLDKALTRRFDAVISFDRYTNDDLLEISDTIMNELLERFRGVGRNKRLQHKILSQMETIPSPGELRNLLRTAVAFSNPDAPYDYLKRLYALACPNNSTDDLPLLRNQGFTIREIEILSGVPRSTVSAELKGQDDE